MPEYWVRAAFWLYYTTKRHLSKKLKNYPLGIAIHWSEEQITTWPLLTNRNLEWSLVVENNSTNCGEKVLPPTLYNFFILTLTLGPPPPKVCPVSLRNILPCLQNIFPPYMFYWSEFLFLASIWLPRHNANDTISVISGNSPNYLVNMWNSEGDSFSNLVNWRNISLRIVFFICSDFFTWFLVTAKFGTNYTHIDHSF